MIIFLILIIVLIQIISYGAISFVVQENRKMNVELAEKLTETYLSKLDKEISANKPSEEEGFDPAEVEELSAEEEFAFRLNSSNEESGDETE